MDCYTGEFEPDRFGFAVEVGGEGMVEGLELGEICLGAGVDGRFEILVRKIIESWQYSKDGVCFVGVVGAVVHVMKVPGAICLVLVLYLGFERGVLEAMVISSENIKIM